MKTRQPEGEGSQRKGEFSNWPYLCAQFGRVFIPCFLEKTFQFFLGLVDRGGTLNS